MNRSITIKPMKPSEVASLYNIDVRTLYNMLKPFDKDKLKRIKTQFFSPKQIRYIFECLDYPENYEPS